FRVGMVPLVHLSAAFDGAMRHVAGRVVLEEIGEDVITALRFGERRLGMEIATVRLGKTLVALDEVGAAGKATRGEPRRQEAALRRLAGVERLAHRTELG